MGQVSSVAVSSALLGHLVMFSPRRTFSICFRVSSSSRCSWPRRLKLGQEHSGVIYVVHICHVTSSERPGATRTQAGKSSVGAVTKITRIPRGCVMDQCRGGACPCRVKVVYLLLVETSLVLVLRRACCGRVFCHASVDSCSVQLLRSNGR